jgi:tetratricopeptide (TPR) repeat protein
MAHCRLGNPEQARKCFEQAGEWSPKDTGTKEEFARFRFEAAESLGIDPWAKETDRLRSEFAASPGNQSLAFNLAMAMLKQGRTEEYHRHCRSLLASATEPRGRRIASRTTLLLPLADSDSELACRLADSAVSEVENEEATPWARQGKALAEYRRGRYESAIDWAGQTVSAGGRPSCTAAARFIQAAAHARLGQIDEARDALSQGGQIGREARPDNPDWPNCVFADSLRCEAVEVIESIEAERSAPRQPIRERAPE